MHTQSPACTHTHMIARWKVYAWRHGCTHFEMDTRSLIHCGFLVGGLTPRTELVADAISLPWMLRTTFFWPPTETSFSIHALGNTASLQDTELNRRTSCPEIFSTCLSHLHSDVWTGSRERQSTGTFCAFHQLPVSKRHPGSSEEEHVETACQPTWKM